jgi:hypothetical protein
MRRMKSRRGSTLVLVALMLAALMGIAAIAADIGRFYVVTGELQTSADAAALKGVAVLQRLTTNYGSMVDDSVTLWAQSTNRSDGDSVVIARDSIDVGWWDLGVNGAAGTWSANPPAGQRPNAVRVKAYGAPRGVFSQMIGRTAGLPLQRTAIAWIGNISLSCTRPWALNYLPLVQKVNGNSDTTQSLDLTKFMAFAGTSAANRTLVMHSSITPSVWPGPIPPDDGEWTPYNLPTLSNGGANAGQTTYQSQLSRCDNIAVNSDAANGDIQPSNGKGPCGAGTVVCWALDAIDGLTTGSAQSQGPGFCTFQANDATCYDKNTGAAGTTVDVTFANVLCANGNGNNCIDFKYVGEVTVACVFVNSTDTCNAIPSPKVKTGYAPGTLVIVAQGLQSRTLNPAQDFASNTFSNIQRFFLVQ